MNFRDLIHINYNLAHRERGLGICIFSRRLRDCDGGGQRTMFAERLRQKNISIQRLIHGAEYISMRQ